MKHLMRSEISRLVGIKYKGSSNEDDLHFLNESMKHILICPSCKKAFEDKAKYLVDALNYRVVKSDDFIALFGNVIEDGFYKLKNLSKTYFCSYYVKNLIPAGTAPLSFARKDYEKTPDYMIVVDNDEMFVITFEPGDLYIRQENKLYQSECIKDEMTYEYKHVFKNVDVKKEFELLKK